MMVKQGSMIQASRRVYKHSTMKVSEPDDRKIGGLRHTAVHGDVIAFDVSGHFSQ